MSPGSWQSFLISPETHADTHTLLNGHQTVSSHHWPYPAQYLDAEHSLHVDRFPGRRPGKTGTERIKQQAFTGSPAANNGHHILTEGDGQFPEADFLAIKNRPFNINLTEMRFWRKLCQPLIPDSEAAFRLQ
jgi:hypothetical protein